jgi:choline monooxygenase
VAESTIDPDVRRAWSLPSEAYTSEAWLARARDKVFARTWHFAGDEDRVRSPLGVMPCTLLENLLDEPIVFTRDGKGELRCLSNVCTHRGNLVVNEEGTTQGLRCRYHGRRFALDGSFVSMPEFEGVENFPAPSDDLARVPFARLGGLLFSSIDPVAPFDEVVAPLRARVGGMLESAVFDADRSRDYDVAANWALYCDNYLEGFHIPFVHQGLASKVEYASYESELHPWGTLQIARAHEGEDAFEGTQIAAYYFFLFPATMLNFYPWGLSLNAVRPLAVDRTRVSFRTYVRDASRIDRGAGADLHRVELEDEAIVEAVQRGVQSRFYGRGRYSPTRETGTHHFHRLLSSMMDR